jgi:release factor glutamine methyltransferase
MTLGDLFEGVDRSLHGTIDVVVSNPPYIPRDFRLSPDIIDHEPHVALFADDQGLAIIERLIAAAREWLKPGGWLILEIGEAQRDAVSRLLVSAGYEDVDIHNDLTERPRIAEGRTRRG